MRPRPETATWSLRTISTTCIEGGSGGREWFNRRRSGGFNSHFFAHRRRQEGPESTEKEKRERFDAMELEMRATYLYRLELHSYSMVEEGNAHRRQMSQTSASFCSEPNDVTCTAFLACFEARRMPRRRRSNGEIARIYGISCLIRRRIKSVPLAWGLGLQAPRRGWTVRQTPSDFARHTPMKI